MATQNPTQAGVVAPAAPADPIAPAQGQQFNVMNESVNANPVTGEVYSVSKTAPTVQLPDTRNIKVDQSFTQTPIQTVQNTPQSDTSGSLMAGIRAGMSVPDITKAITPAQTETSQKVSAAQAKLEELIGQMGGKGAATTKAEQDAGLPELKKNLAELNSQILTKSAEYDKLFTDIEGKPIPMSDINSQQRQVIRQKAAEVGLLQARALGMQGQVQSAQETAKRAVDLMYQDKEDEFNLRLKQLDILTPQLDKEEKRQADALTLKLNAEKDLLDEEKAASKVNLGLVLEAGINTPYVNKGGEWFNTRNGKPYSKPAELFKDAGVSSFEELYAKGLVTDYSPDRAADRNFVSQVMAKYPDAGVTISDTPETAQAKLSKSRIYQKETYIAPTRGTGVGSGAAGTGPNGAVTDYDVLAGALSTSLGSVAAMDKFQSQWNAAKTDEQKLKVLTAYAKMPPDIKKEVIQSNQASAALTDVQKLLDSGVQTGLLAAGQSYFANKTGTGADKKVEEIKARLTSALQQYRSNVTGAAWGDQEQAEYDALVGGVKFSPEDLANKVAIFKDILKQKSQTALLSAIDLTGAINNNSVIQSQPGFETTNRDSQGTAQPAEMVLPDGTILKLQPDGTYQ